MVELSSVVTRPSSIFICRLSFRLSGLSPFMGDNDAETLTNVTLAEWDFDDEAFDDISDDSKEFIETLLVKDLP